MEEIQKRRDGSDKHALVAGVKPKTTRRETGAPEAGAASDIRTAPEVVTAEVGAEVTRWIEVVMTAEVVISHNT